MRAPESLLAKRAPVRTKDLTADLIEGVVSPIPGFQMLEADRRFLYPHLAQKPVTNELSVADFRQTGSRTVNGDVERELHGYRRKGNIGSPSLVRDPAAKAGRGRDRGRPERAAPGRCWLAVVSRLRGPVPAPRAIDAQVINALEFSDHTVDLEGDSLVAQIRYAIAAHRAEGFNPTILAVPGITAAQLDLQLEDGGYVFPVSAIGGSSPLFSQTVVEVSGLWDPLLIDPAAVGVLALGPSKVGVDQSKGFSQNLSSIRVEASVLMVLRNSKAVYEIAGGSIAGSTPPNPRSRSGSG